MKTLIRVLLFISLTSLGARAELTNAVVGTVIHSPVTILTNDLSPRDLQDLLGVTAYKFNVHCSSATNGLAVYVEASVEGKLTNSIAHLELDRMVLETEHAGEDITVFVAVNPVGSLDGEGILSAKKLRCFLSEAGVKTSGTGDNPFYKSKDGIKSWGPHPAQESANIFKFMESGGGANSAKPRTELRIRFREF